MHLNHPLIRLLRSPKQAAPTLSPQEWTSAVRAARQGQLLGRLGHLLTTQGLLSNLPEPVRNHLESANRVSASQHRNVRWEIQAIHHTLGAEEIPFVILKGGAYIAKNYEASHGRTLSDIDIMVPHARIIDAERAFIGSGWFPGKLNPYDQRYYREWMHELPPLRHLERGTTLDVHHTILPPTASLKPDVAQLWAKAIPLEGHDRVFVLSPEDMVIHSATHLFHDGEMEHGLRDLIDMDSLITEFEAQEKFWKNLAERAQRLDLGRPLYYALRCREYFLGKAAPASVLHDISSQGKYNSRGTQQVLEFLKLAIGDILSEQPVASITLAKLAVFVRSHYLRMPLYLLIPHLLRKMVVPKPE